MRKSKMKHTCIDEHSEELAGRGAFLAESIFYKYLLVKKIMCFWYEFINYKTNLTFFYANKYKFYLDVLLNL